MREGLPKAVEVIWMRGVKEDPRGDTCPPACTNPRQSQHFSREGNISSGQNLEMPCLEKGGSPGGGNLPEVSLMWREIVGVWVAADTSYMQSADCCQGGVRTETTLWAVGRSWPLQRKGTKWMLKHPPSPTSHLIWPCEERGVCQPPVRPQPPFSNLQWITFLKE